MPSVLVQIHEAIDLHQSWMDLTSLEPYVQVRTGRTGKKTTQTVKDGGKNAIFDEALTLNYKLGDSIRFIVKDERLVLFDKLVGFGIVPYASFSSTGRCDVFVPLIRDETKEGGGLKVTIYLNNDE